MKLIFRLNVCFNYFLAHKTDFINFYRFNGKIYTCKNYGELLKRLMKKL